MNKLPKKLIAIVMLISIAGSSLASESIKVQTANSVTVYREKLTVPLLLSKKSAFDSADFAKYQMMQRQSQAAVTRDAAGASDTKTTVITVVVVVVVVAGIALLVWTHGGQGIPVGNIGNALAK